MSLHILPAELCAHVCSYLHGVHRIMARCAWAGFAAVIAGPCSAPNIMKCRNARIKCHDVRVKCPQHDICASSVLAEDRRMLDIAYARSRAITADCYAAAATVNNILILDYLLACDSGKTMPYPKHIAAVASRDFLAALVPHKNISAYNAAMLFRGTLKGGRPDVVAYILEKFIRDIRDQSSICPRIGRCTDVGILQMLYNMGIDITRPLISAAAAKNNNVVCLNFLHAMGIRVTSAAILDCMRKIQLDTVKLVHKNGCEFKSSIYVDATEDKRLDIIDWLYGVGIPLPPRLYRTAIACGRINILEWLYGTGGVKPEVSHIRQAVKYGFKKVIKYLLSIDCPCTDSVVELAAKYGQNVFIRHAPRHYLRPELYIIALPIQRAVRALYESGCPWPDDLAQHMVAAGATDCIIYAHSVGIIKIADLYAWS